MALVELNIYQRRTTGKNANRQSRLAGRIPAVLYSKGRKTSNVELDTHEFTKVLANATGSSVIFALKQEERDKDAIALLQEIQRNPVNDSILHVDLFEIPRNVPITAPVRIEVRGESLAVKRGEANLAVVLDTVDISCLPRELPDEVEVDISPLGLGDRLYVKDLVAPIGEITTDPDTLVLLLKAPTIFVEEVAEEAEAAATGEEAAGEGEAKTSGGEGAADKGEGR